MKLLKLAYGSHPDPEQQTGKLAKGCAMELVSYIAGESWSDTPACTSPMLATLMQQLNDRAGNDDALRADLTTYLPRLVGTRDKALEPARYLAAADYALRVIMPMKYLEQGRDGWAQLLSGLAPIDSSEIAGQHWLVVAKRIRTGIPVSLLAAVYTEQWGLSLQKVTGVMFGVERSRQLLDHVLKVGPGAEVPDDWFERSAELVGTLAVADPVPV